MHAHACMYIFCCALHTVCSFTIAFGTFVHFIQWIFIFVWNCLIAWWWCWRCCVLHSCHCITSDACRTHAHKKYASKHALTHTPTSDGNNSNINNCTHFNFSKRCGFVQCSRLSMDPTYCIYTLSVNHTAKYVIHTLTALHTDTFISFHYLVSFRSSWSQFFTHWFVPNRMPCGSWLDKVARHKNLCCGNEPKYEHMVDRLGWQIHAHNFFFAAHERMHFSLNISEMPKNLILAISHKKSFYANQCQMLANHSVFKQNIKIFS